MQSPTYITPGLGGKSLMILGGWTLVALVIPWLVSEGVLTSISPSSWDPMLGFSWRLGVVIGLGSGLFWLATSISSPLIRGILRIAVVGLLGLLLSRLGTPDWFRHAANTAGLLIGQSLWFAWIGVPAWAKGGSTRNSDSGSTGQFAIADLIAMTTAIACLLAVVIRYVPPVDAKIYWIVTLLFWCLSPMISAGFVTASLACTRRAAEKALALGLLGVVVLAVGMSVAETLISADGKLSNLAIPFLYLIVLLAFGATMSVFGFAGRCQVWRDHGVASLP